MEERAKKPSTALDVLFLGLLMLLGSMVFGQKEDYNWSFGEGVGITFNTTPPSTYPHNFGDNGALNEVYESMASVSDANGVLQFYTNGLSVLRANDSVMAGGNNTIKGADDGGGVSASQGVLVIGAPKNPNLYYIFTCDAGNCVFGSCAKVGLNYATVDMTANVGAGQVSASTRLKTDAGVNFNTTEMLAAVKHANGCDVWIVTRDSKKNIFYSYLLTSTGINVNATTKSTYTGLVPGGYLSADEGRGSMTFSNAGNKLAVAHHAQWPYENSLSLFDFNQSTGAITLSTELGNTLGTSTDAGYDVVWSPNDTKIYVSYVSIWDINQYDVTTWGNAAAIKATETIVPGTQVAAAGGDHSPSGQILIGPDGKLYRAMKNTNYLATISGNLDGPVAGLTYNKNAVSLGTNTSDAALPNMIPKAISFASIDTTGINPICNTKSPFNLKATPAGGTWTASCGACITNSSLGTFDPAIAGAGSHTITYTISACNFDSKLITISNCGVACPDTSLAPSIPAICSGNTVDLALYDGTAAAGTWSIQGAGANYPTLVGTVFTTTSATAAGTYTVRYTLSPDPGGACAKYAERTIRVKALPVDGIADKQICKGSSATSFDAGNTGATYVWSGLGSGNGQTTVAGTDGVYNVAITLNGCTINASATLTVIDTPVVNMANQSICAGAPAVIFDAGNVGATYVWSGDTTGNTQTITTSKAGNYKVTVTKNGCSGSGSATLTVKANPTDDIADKQICKGAPATSFDAGNPGATYLWSGLGSGTGRTTSAGNAGVYNVAITLNGCTINADAILTVIDTPVVTMANKSICEGTGASFDAGNTGANFVWSDNGTGTAQTTSAFISGKYTVTVSKNGCSGKGSATLTVVDTPVVSMANQSICKGTSAVFDAGNIGATYVWSGDTTGNTQTITTSKAGNYKVTVTKNGCSGSGSATLTVVDTPLVTMANQSICEGSPSVSFDAGNTGSTYIWSGDTIGNTQTITTSKAGIYKVTVTKNGCSGSGSATLTVNPLPIITLSDQSICKGDTTWFKAGGAFTSYQWGDNGTGSSDSSIATKDGKYTVTVSDGTCSNSASANLSYYTKPNVTLNNLEYCEGSTAPSFDAGAGYSSYQWSGKGSGNSEFEVADSAGIYTVIVSNNTGCKDTASATLTINTKPNISIANDTICEGDAAVTFDAGLGYSSYEWSGPKTGNNSTLSTNITGTYTVIVVDNKSCRDTTDVTLTVNTKPNISLSGTSICEGDPAVTFDIGAGFSFYEWSGPINGNSSTLTTNSAGTYQIIVHDANGCKDTTTATLTVDTLPSFNLPDTSVCPGGSILLAPIPNNFAGYHWSTGSSLSYIDYSTPNTSVSLTVTDGNNCKNTKSAFISMGDTLHVDFGPDIELCENATVVLDASEYGPFVPSVTYTWDNVLGGASKTITQNGSYGVVVMDGRGCIGGDTVNVIYHANPTVSLGNDTSVCFTGKEVFEFELPSGYSKITWSTSSTNQKITLMAPGNISVEVENNYGCKANDALVVTEKCEPTQFCFPNVTTPNGDGMNDDFFPMDCDGKAINDGNYKHFMDNVVTVEFEVFDRWGIKVFQSQNVLPRWDGNYNGSGVTGGVYYWIINYTDSSHKNYQETGWVEVIK